MDSQSSIKVMHHLYGVLMELNAYRDDAEVLEAIQSSNNEGLIQDLRFVKLLTAKCAARHKIERFSKVRDKLEALRLMGEQELNRILKPEDAMQLTPLFRKFKSLSEEDQEGLLDDEQFLRLLDILDESDDDI